MITVGSPNTDRSLLTIEEARVAAGLASNDASKDAVLTPLNNYVAAMITKACKVAKAGIIPPTLRLETVSERFMYKNLHKSLVLSRRPVVAIASVTQMNSALSASDYVVDEAAGVLYRTGTSFYFDRLGWCDYWPSGDTVVVYSAGFATVPDDLKYAAIKFLQAEYVTGSRDPNLKSLTIEGVSSREWWVSDKPVTSALPGEVMDILIRGGYVNMVLA